MIGEKSSISPQSLRMFHFAPGGNGSKWGKSGAKGHEMAEIVGRDKLKRHKNVRGVGALP